MAKVKVKFAYKNLKEDENKGDILSYGYGNINPYDPESDLCNELAYSYALTFAKNLTGHENVKIMGWSHEEVIDDN